MERIKVYYDPMGNTLHIWFGDPREEFVTEEADEELGVVRNKQGEVIGIEKLNFLPARLCGALSEPVTRLKQDNYGQTFGFEFDPHRYEKVVER